MNKKTKLEDFYEDADDALAGFRKTYKGGVQPLKNGKDPFDSDPDVIQAKRQDKLADDQKNMFLGY